MPMNRETVAAIVGSLIGLVPIATKAVEWGLTFMGLASLKDDLTAWASFLTEPSWVIWAGLIISFICISYMFGAFDQGLPYKNKRFLFPHFGIGSIDDVAWYMYQETKAADMYGPADRDDIIRSGIIALIVDGRANDPIIYGTKPNSLNYEPIPGEDLKDYHLGSDDKSLLDLKSQPPKLRWENLSVRWRGLARHIERQKEAVRQHLREFGRMP